MLVARISGSPIALALKDRMWEDHMGATSMATGFVPFDTAPKRLHLLSYLYRLLRRCCRLVQIQLEGSEKNPVWLT